MLSVGAVKEASEGERHITRFQQNEEICVIGKKNFGLYRGSTVLSYLIITCDHDGHPILSGHVGVVPGQYVGKGIVSRRVGLLFGQFVDVLVVAQPGFVLKITVVWGRVKRHKYIEHFTCKEQEL